MTLSHLKEHDEIALYPLEKLKGTAGPVGNKHC
jgi:hypothetical protein